MNTNAQDSPDAVNAATDHRAEPPPESQVGNSQALLAAIRKITHIEDLEFDADGDISLQRGTQMVNVRLPENAQLVRIWSPLLRSVGDSTKLLVRLNRLNMGTSSVRFCFLGGVIFAEAVVDARPLLVEHIKNALRRFGDATDGLDALLQGEFGGFTAAPGVAASVRVH